MYTKASCCDRCRERFGCVSWTMSLGKTSLGLFPVVGIITSTYDFYKYHRELKEIDDCIRIDNPVASPYYMQSSEPLFDRELLSGIINPQEETRLDEAYSLEEMRPIVAALRCNSLALLVLSTTFTAGVVCVGLYVVNVI